MTDVVGGRKFPLMSEFEQLNSNLPKMGIVDKSGKIITDFF